MSKWVWGYSIWGGKWLLVDFLVYELLGFFGVAPWPTLSETIWHVTRTYPWTVEPIFATIVFLTVHFLYHRPILISIAFGLIVAYGAHTLDRALP
jgi:hypothetical protein